MLVYDRHRLRLASEGHGFLSLLLPSSTRRSQRHASSSPRLASQVEILKRVEEDIKKQQQAQQQIAQSLS